MGYCYVRLITLLSKMLIESNLLKDVMDQPLEKWIWRELIPFRFYDSDFLVTSTLGFKVRVDPHLT